MLILTAKKQRCVYEIIKMMIVTMTNLSTMALTDLPLSVLLSLIYKLKAKPLSAKAKAMIISQDFFSSDSSESIVYRNQFSAHRCP